MKYYNAERYEVDRYQDAIIKYQVRMLVLVLLRVMSWPCRIARAKRIGCEVEGAWAQVLI